MKVWWKIWKSYMTPNIYGCKVPEFCQTKFPLDSWTNSFWMNHTGRTCHNLWGGDTVLDTVGKLHVPTRLKLERKPWYMFTGSWSSYVWHEHRFRWNTCYIPLIVTQTPIKHTRSAPWLAWLTTTTQLKTRQKLENYSVKSNLNLSSQLELFWIYITLSHFLGVFEIWNVF